MRELNLQRLVALDASTNGWIAEHYESKKLLLPNGMYADSGVPVGYPDLTLYVAPGIVCFVELKVNKNKPSKEQLEFQSRMRSRGYISEIIYSMQEWEGVKTLIIHKYNLQGVHY